MSYDISLYVRSFLRRAVDTELDDWTGADPIPDETILVVVSHVEAAGFVEVPVDEAFAAFAREQGSLPGREFRLETPELLAELTIRRGEIAFAIPASPRSEASIDLCSRVAREAAARCGLGFHDPQAGIADC
jgi:hypothetical protein